MAQDIARLYQQCDPARPLQPGDPRYIPFEGVRGEGDLIAQLTNALRWSDVPLQVLFAGHRGGGKSTELLRLQHALTRRIVVRLRHAACYSRRGERRDGLL
jgi:hypothetical protein